MKYALNKNGEVVSVSDDLMRKLITSGKKTEADFYDNPEDIQLAQSGQEQRNQADIERLRMEGADISSKAQELSVNPQMQEEQIGGVADRAGTYLARFMFPTASRVAERGGSREDITGTALAEAPLIAATALAPELRFSETLGLAGLGAATSNVARKSAGEQTSAEEAGISAGSQFVPYAGGRMLQGLGRTATEVAPNVLHSVVVPKSGVMKGANPPDFRFALEKEGLIENAPTLQGQINKLEQNLQKESSRLSKERANIQAWKEGQIDVVNEAFINTTDAISKMKATPIEEAKMFAELEKLQKSYAAKYGNESLNIETAMTERKALGKESGMWDTEIDDSPAMKKVKSLVRGEIGKLVKKESPEVMAKTAEIAPYEALLNPMRNTASLTRGKTVIPLGLTQSAITGAMAGGFPGAILGAGAYQLTKSPIGAKRLYNFGRMIESDVAQRAIPYAQKTAMMAGQANIRK